jgi:hypothetical protein
MDKDLELQRRMWNDLKKWVEHQKQLQVKGIISQQSRGKGWTFNTWEVLDEMNRLEKAYGVG